MRLVTIVFLTGLALVSVGGVSREARAQSISTCSTAYPCVWWQNTNASGSAAIVGQNSTAAGNGVEGASVNRIGVAGTSTNYYGVGAGSTNGVGLYAASSNHDGIETVTSHSSHSAIYAHNNASGGGGWGVFATTAGNGKAVAGRNFDAAGWAGYFEGKVYASAGYTSSDARLKKDVKESPYGLREALALRPVTFKWKSEKMGGETQVGLIAQEVQKFVPEAVNRDAVSGMLSINYQAVVPILIKAIQEQEKTIQSHENRIARLERGPVLSSSLLSGGLLLGLLPLGVLIGRRARRPQHQQAAE